jgi:hypothetical protein
MEIQVMHFFFSFILASFSALAFLAWTIKKKEWTARRKKWTFTFSGALLLFPAFVPAGTIAALPFPFSAAMMVAFFSGDGIAFLIFIGKLWMFTLPSFLLTALFCRGLAAMIFYEYRKTA